MAYWIAIIIAVVLGGYGWLIIEGSGHNYGAVVIGMVVLVVSFMIGLGTVVMWVVRKLW